MVNVNKHEIFPTMVYQFNCGFDDLKAVDISQMNAYILADRASWLNFGNKGDLALLYAGDPVLFNQYAYLPVNPALHRHLKTTEAASLEAWLTSPRAKELINNYQISGEKLFFFNAE